MAEEENLETRRRFLSPNGEVREIVITGPTMEPVIQEMTTIELAHLARMGLSKISPENMIWLPDVPPETEEDERIQRSARAEFFNEVNRDLHSRGGRALGERVLARNEKERVGAAKGGAASNLTGDDKALHLAKSIRKRDSSLSDRELAKAIKKQGGSSVSNSEETLRRKIAQWVKDGKVPSRTTAEGHKPNRGKKRR